MAIKTTSEAVRKQIQAVVSLRDVLNNLRYRIDYAEDFSKENPPEKIKDKSYPNRHAVGTDRIPAEEWFTSYKDISDLDPDWRFVWYTGDIPQNLEFSLIASEQSAWRFVPERLGDEVSELSQCVRILGDVCDKNHWPSDAFDIFTMEYVDEIPTTSRKRVKDALLLLAKLQRKLDVDGGMNYRANSEAQRETQKRQC